MLTHYTGKPGKMGEKPTKNDRILGICLPPHIPVWSLLVSRSGDIQIPNMRCSGRFRGGVIAGGAPIALKNMVNFPTNLLTNFTTNHTRGFARVLFRALVGRVVRGGLSLS